MTDYEIEIEAIDLSPYREGNTGINYVHRLDSGRPGPRVLVNALTHGNELCGAHALAKFLDDAVMPSLGMLTLSFANIAAYETFNPSNPTQSRFVDEDFNRLWSIDILSSDRQSSELTRARALRSVVAEADYLLDIHSMLGPSPALMLSGLAEKGRSLARAVGRPIHIIADGGHKAGPRMRDFGDFGNPDHPRTALLVECGQHWKQESVNCAIDTMIDFLSALDMLDPEVAAERRLETPPLGQRMIEVTHAVTVETDRFEFEREFTGLEVIGEADTIIAVDDERPIATPYENCVLVMPSRNALKGQTAVRLGKLLD